MFTWKVSEEIFLKNLPNKLVLGKNDIRQQTLKAKLKKPSYLRGLF